MLVKVYKIGEVHFRLLRTTGFHVKAENERFTAAGSRRRQTLKRELTNRRLWLDAAVWSRHFSRRRPAEIGVYDSQRTRRRRCRLAANFPPFF